MTGILFLYLDLYLALKKRSILRPVISTKVAFLMVVVAWLIWLGIAGIGYPLKDPDWNYTVTSSCNFSSGLYNTKYVITVCSVFLVLFVVILICHLGTLRVMREAHRSLALSARRNTTTVEEQPQRQVSENSDTFNEGSSTAAAADPKLQRNLSITTSNRKSIIPTAQEKAQSKWLKKNISTMRIVVIVMCIFSICWYPSIILILILAICDNCLPYLVTYLFSVLIIVQYISNGFVYLAKSREFQEAFRRLFSCCCKKRVTPECINLPAPTREAAQ